jgi:hypothetical protein
MVRFGSIPELSVPRASFSSILCPVTSHDIRAQPGWIESAFEITAPSGFERIV